ncbi:MAG: hypothetical protein WBA13_04495 [Microcoleaceae cyanobacterium]
MMETNLTGFIVMTLKPKLLHQKPFDSPCVNLHSTSEFQALTLFEQYTLIQAEIDSIQATIEQLKINIIFHPPSKFLPIEERLEIHFKSIKTAKQRAKLLNKTQLNLAQKQQEINQIQLKLSQRQAEANQAIKCLQLLAKTMKQTKREYTQVLEEFHTAAYRTQQILIDAYGQHAGDLFERRLKADIQALPQHHHSLIYSLNG